MSLTLKKINHAINIFSPSVLGFNFAYSFFSLTEAFSLLHLNPLVFVCMRVCVSLLSFVPNIETFEVLCYYL